jgi:hypothetical protein
VSFCRIIWKVGIADSSVILLSRIVRRNVLVYLEFGNIIATLKFVAPIIFIHSKFYFSWETTLTYIFCVNYYILRKLILYIPVIEFRFSLWLIVATTSFLCCYAMQTWTMFPTFQKYILPSYLPSKWALLSVTAEKHQMSVVLMHSAALQRVQLRKLSNPLPLFTQKHQSPFSPPCFYLTES